MSTRKLTHHVERDRIRYRNDDARNRYTGRLMYTLKVTNYLHIGQGDVAARYSKNLKDATGEKDIVKDFQDIINTLKKEGRDYKVEFFRINGVPAVPGATLKGACRSNVELRFVNKNMAGRFLTCLVNTRGGRQSQDRNVRHRVYYGFGSTKLIPERRNCPPVDYRRDRNLSSRSTCLSCQLFGKMGLRGLVQYSPAYLLGKQRTNSSQFKFFPSKFGGEIELATSGTLFKGELIFRNITLAELGLLFFLGFRYKQKSSYLLGYSKFGDLEIKNGETKPMGKTVFTPYSLAFSGNKPSFLGTKNSVKSDKLNEVICTNIYNEMKSQYGAYIQEVTV